MGTTGPEHRWGLLNGSGWGHSVWTVNKRTDRFSLWTSDSDPCLTWSNPSQSDAPETDSGSDPLRNLFRWSIWNRQERSNWPIKSKHQITDGSLFIIDGTLIETPFIKDLEKTPMTFLNVEFYSVRDTTIEGNFISKARVYTKLIGTYQYVPWRSSHPPGVKKGIIKGELSRRLRLCSSEYDWITTCHDLKSKLSSRGYPVRRSP